jgi:hypothetical protein
MSLDELFAPPYGSFITRQLGFCGTLRIPRTPCRKVCWLHSATSINFKAA